MGHKVPVQSLIDHIKTSTDVDPWAKEWAEELLNERNQIVHCKDCKHYKWLVESCDHIGGAVSPDWFCADGERKKNG